VVTTAQLTRTNQRLAKEALSIPQALASKLEASLDQLKRQHDRDNLDGGNQDQQNQSGH